MIRINAEYIEALWDQINPGTPDYWHNHQHPMRMLEALDRYCDKHPLDLLDDNRLIMEYAILFHDAYNDILDDQKEEKSTDLMRAELCSMGLHELVDDVAHVIMSTKYGLYPGLAKICGVEEEEDKKVMFMIDLMHDLDYMQFSCESAFNYYEVKFLTEAKAVCKAHQGDSIQYTDKEILEKQIAFYKELLEKYTMKGQFHLFSTREFEHFNEQAKELLEKKSKPDRIKLEQFQKFI